MQSGSTLRVCIKPHLQAYVQQKADEWGISDFGEVVNLLVLEHKRVSPQLLPSALPIGQQLPIESAPEPQPEPQKSIKAPILSDLVGMLGD